MTEFGQLVTILVSCLSATIGVCVYLLKTQQKERERTEERNDARLDKLFGMIDGRVHEQTEVIRELNNTLQELSDAVKDQSHRLEAVEIAVGKKKATA